MSVDSQLPQAATVEDARVRRVELVISALLRIGVVTSLAVVAIGMVVMFVRHPSYWSSSSDLNRLLSPEATFPHTVREAFSQAVALRGEGLIVVGLVLLIATPVMRVAVSILAFVYQKDRLFVAITSLVLSLLLLSFVLGRAGG